MTHNLAEDLNHKHLWYCFPKTFFGGIGGPDPRFYWEKWLNLVDFSLHPVFSGWGRENLERDFRRHWTRNFPVTRDFGSEPHVHWATQTWLVLGLCVGSKHHHRWGRRHLAAATQHCGSVAALAKCPQLQQWTKKLPCDFKPIWLRFKSKLYVGLKSDPDCLI